MAALESGGRLLLRLQSVEPTLVRYAGELRLPTHTVPVEARVLREAHRVEVDVGSSEAAPPPWLVEFVVTTLRVTSRSRPPGSNDPWPRRLTRWRDEPAER